MKNFNTGTGHDEINYIDIQTHAMKTYNAQKSVIYVSQIQELDKNKIKRESLFMKLANIFSMKK